MKSKLFLIAFMLFSAISFAQDIEVSGKVTEAATGLPMPGVSIALKNTTVSTATDLDGNYVLKVPKGSTLIFSFIGFQTIEQVANTSSISLALKEDAKTLEEVVVIGYGTQKRKEVTGAVGYVGAETIEKLKPVKIEQALQGTVAGVNVTTTSGAPGAPLTVRIRGIGSNGNADPYVLIDGYVGDINTLNPGDIESISVLKDAQAAIYGVLGANGVVLITTKKGRKNQKPQLVYNVYSGFQETSRKLPTLNATEYGALLNESYANGGQALPFPNLSGLGKGTDWQKEVFGKAVPMASHDLTLSGGSETITYSVGGSHIDQKGIVGDGKSQFERNTGRIALGIDITPKLKLNTNIIYTQLYRNSLSEGALGSVLFNAINVPATLKPYDENGEYTLVPSTTGFGTEIINPLAQVANTYNDYNLRKLNGTINADYEVLDGLKFTARFGFNTGNSRGRTFNKQVSYGGKIYDVQRSSVDQNAINDNDFTFDLYGTYEKVFAETHHFTFTTGTTLYKTYGEALYATGYDIPYNSWEFADISLANGLSDAKSNSSYVYDVRRVSHFARLQYDYKGRYLVSFMGRRDLSTRFAPENKVAYFPSATAGWALSEEPFFNKDGLVSFAKLRASYGILGSDGNLGSAIYFPGLSGEAMYVFNNTLTSGVANGVVPNRLARWEESRKFDVGADINLFKNKVTLTADYFSDTRKDLLVPNIPTSSIIGIGAPGASAPTVNAGTVKNSGFEFAIGYKDNITDNFKMDVNYNVSFINNKVTEVNNGTGFYPGGTFGLSDQPSRMEIGKPMGYFYGYKMEGIFQNQAEIDNAPSQAGLGSTSTSPGDIRFKDVNGDGIITAADRTDLGNPIPNATMGFNITLHYKGFDFTAYAFASLGNDMIRAYERDVPNGNRLNYVLNRWTGEGTSNSIPRVTTGATNNKVFSSYYVEDASYCRIQNVQLGYTLNPEWTKGALSKVRIYAGVNNLYTFTKYMGYDPGASNGSPIGGGIDYGFYPVPRTYLIGANINF